MHTTPAAFTVLVADKLDPEGLEILKAAGLRVEVRPGLTPEQVAEAAREVDAILVRSATKIGAPVFAAARRLRAVGRAGIGVDTIDVEAASRHGVLVMNTPHANAVTTGELALAHLFALARRLPAADASMKAGRWEKGTLTGAEITGKTLAIVGLGKIGRVVAERALGLRMSVVAFDPFLHGPSPVPGVEHVDFDTALARADFLSIHVPLSAETRELLDATALAKMKPTAFLINCARGGIVDEDALLAALNAGRLAGAGLDVFETEPLPADSPLRLCERLVLTPHLGASSEEAQKRVSVEIAQQMVDYLLRGEARGAVNAPALSPEQLAVLRPWLSLARRCGLLLAQTAGAPIERVEITYAGELAGRPTDALRAEILAGVLAPSLAGPVNAVNAALLAAERGLRLLESREEQGSDYASLLSVEAVTRSKDGNIAAPARRNSVSGTVVRGRPRLVEFDGFGVDFEPRGVLLLTRHRDTPGVLGQVATFLGGRNINIGGLHMGAVGEAQAGTGAQAGDGARGSDGQALALYQIARALSPEELDALRKLPPIASALCLNLGD
ncbi:MAG: phosphoglycerate dehydrogenase [Planctomycetota bacterium]